MRWLVEIIDIVADKRFLVDLLASLKVTLYREENRNYLTSDQFELLSTSTEVWKQAERLCDILAEVSLSEVRSRVLSASINFKLGDLYEQREDGSRRTHVFVYGAPIGASAGASVGGAEFSVIVTSTPEITEEERARLEAERLEREYQEKLALVSSRVVSAFRDERALKVYRFLQQDLTPTRMYHIYELIRDDFGGNMNSLASDKDWTRFTRSVNHQEVFGDDSRHIASKEKPPANPMSLSEAQAFISKVADSWFRQKCVDDSIAQQPR